MLPSCALLLLLLLAYVPLRAHEALHHNARCGMSTNTAAKGKEKQQAVFLEFDNSFSEALRVLITVNDGSHPQEVYLAKESLKAVARPVPGLRLLSRQRLVAASVPALSLLDSEQAQVCLYPPLMGAWTPRHVTLTGVDRLSPVCSHVRLSACQTSLQMPAVTNSYILRAKFASNACTLLWRMRDGSGGALTYARPKPRTSTCQREGGAGSVCMFHIHGFRYYRSR